MYWALELQYMSLWGMEEGHTIQSIAGLLRKNFRITFCCHDCSSVTCKMSRFFAGSGDRSASLIVLSEMQGLLRPLLLDFFQHQEASLADLVTGVTQLIGRLCKHRTL